MFVASLPLSTSVTRAFYGPTVRALRGMTARTVDKEPKWRHTGKELTTGYKRPWTT